MYYIKKKVKTEKMETDDELFNPEIVSIFCDPL